MVARMREPGRPSGRWRGGGPGGGCGGADSSRGAGGPGRDADFFPGGLDTLPKRAAELGDSVRLGSGSLPSKGEGKGRRPFPNLDRSTSRGGIHRGRRGGGGGAVTPGSPSSPDLGQGPAGTVGEIRTAGLAVVALAFDAAAMGGAPDGFGFLVPRGTGPRILGCLWDSSIFPGRAPEGKVLLRAMIGGAHDPEAVAERKRRWWPRSGRTSGRPWDSRRRPLFSRVYRWPLGIGQYTVGHQNRLDRIHSGWKHIQGFGSRGVPFTESA